MLRLTMVLLVMVTLVACAGGGGGSATGPKDGDVVTDKGTLTYSRSTLSANTAYMKDGDQVTITVQPSNGAGAAYDISGEWTITVFTLCYTCGGTQTPTIHHSDFTKAGNSYEGTFTAPASSKVDFLLRFDKVDNSAALDNGNVPKLVLNEYSACDESIPNGQILRTATISGTAYNLLCDMTDLEKMALVRDGNGDWYVKNSYSLRQVTGTELTAYQALSSQSFYVMKDIVATANYSFDRFLPVTGLVDMTVHSGLGTNIAISSGTVVPNGPAFTGTIEGNNHEVDSRLVGYVSGTLRNIKLKDMSNNGSPIIYGDHTTGATFTNVTFLTSAYVGALRLYSKNCGMVSVSGGNVICVGY